MFERNIDAETLGAFCNPEVREMIPFGEKPGCCGNANSGQLSGIFL